MKKKDLKGGMVVELRDGRMRLIIESHDIRTLIRLDGVCEAPLSCYNKNLQYSSRKSKRADIMKVYSIEYSSFIVAIGVKSCNHVDRFKEELTLIWERNESHYCSHCGSKLNGGKHNASFY